MTKSFLQFKRLKFKRLKRLLIFLAGVLFFRGQGFALSEFGDLAINANNDVLFSVVARNTPNSDHKSLLLGKVNSERTFSCVTPFPESVRAASLKGFGGAAGKGVAIKNSFGEFLLTQDGVLTQTKGFATLRETSLKTTPSAISEDALWECVLNKASATTGKLLLKNLATGKSVVIDSRAKLDYEKCPVKWAKDGLLFYEKQGAIYFARASALLSGNEVVEEYRKIGNGTIASIATSRDKLLFVEGERVYCVALGQLYSLMLYGSLVGRLPLLGRLSHDFDGTQDAIFTDAELTVLLIKSDKTLVSYDPNKKEGEYLSILSQKTFINSQHLTVKSSVFFSQKGAYLWVLTLPFDNKPPVAFIYDVKNDFETVLTIEDTLSLTLSPEKNLCAFAAGVSLYIYDTTSWKRLNTFVFDRVKSVLWLNEDEVFVGGESCYRLYKLSDKSEKLIAPASVQSAAFEGPEVVKALSAKGDEFLYSIKARRWTFGEGGNEKGSESYSENATNNLSNKSANKSLSISVLYNISNNASNNISNNISNNVNNNLSGNNTSGGLFYKTSNNLWGDDSLSASASSGISYNANNSTSNNVNNNLSGNSARYNNGNGAFYNTSGSSAKSSNGKSGNSFGGSNNLSASNNTSGNGYNSYGGNSKIDADLDNEGTLNKPLSGDSLSKSKSLVNKKYRVFLGEAGNGAFANAIYVRSLADNKSAPLFFEAAAKENVEKRVVLVFDAYDDAQGLGEVLYTLRNYNLPATFFINGDFINRYPKETKLLSMTGNLCASMFFTSEPLVNENFICDKDYIVRGLARCEDEYFSVTQEELALLWHAPKYLVTSQIIDWGKDAGYSYLKASNITMDEIATGDERSGAMRLLDAYIAQVEKGGTVVIPFTLGGQSKGALSLDLLINAITSTGSSVVSAKVVAQ